MGVAEEFVTLYHQCESKQHFVHREESVYYLYMHEIELFISIITANCTEMTLCRRRITSTYCTFGF